MVKKLLTKLKSTLESNISRYGILLLFTVLSTYSLLFLIPFFITIIKLRKKIKAKILIPLILIFLISYFSYYLLLNIKFSPGTYKVSHIFDYGYQKLVVIKKGFIRYAFYSKGGFNKGDIIKINGKSLPKIKLNIFNKLSSNDYFYKNKISSLIKATNIKVLKKGKASKIVNFLELFPKNIRIFVALLINPNYISYDIRKNLTDLGLISIVLMSSIQIGFIIKIIKKILYYTPLGNISKNIIISLVLLILSTLFKGNFPLIRYLIIYLLLFIAELLGAKISKFQLNYLSFIIISILFPYFLYSYSYKITFTYLFISPYFHNLLKKFHPLIKYIISYYLFYLITIPILSQFVNEFSLFTFLMGPLFFIVFKYFIIPIFYLSLIIYPISYLTNPIFKYLLKLINIFSDNKLYLIIPRFNFLFQIAYFLFLLLIIFSNRKIKYTFLFLLTILINQFKFYINPFKGVTYFNVGQGNSTLIRDNFGKNTILIDYFGNTRKKLRSMGVYKIDHLILTHNDYDHIGNIEIDSQYLKIDKVYLNDSDKYPNIKCKKKITITSDYKCNLGNIKMHFLYINKPYQKNDNSLLTKINIGNTTFLSTGDITKIAEKDYINKYQEYLKCDILHIPHHGSKGSLSNDFLKYTNPKLGIISCGVGNMYNFPDNSTIEKLKKRKINYEITYTRNNLNYLIFKKKFYLIK